MELRLGSEFDLRSDLARLARFGANLSDSHSCLIFLPTSCLALIDHCAVGEELLELVAFHSLSNDVITGYRITPDSGLIGWVSRHKRSIHVSPFEHDSRTLGIYSEEQALKSFIGIPLPLDFLEGHESLPAGVVACDSKKSFAFSKLQGKLLEDLACEISNNVRLRAFNDRGQLKGLKEMSWDTFMKKAKQLEGSLGSDSIEIMRVRVTNFHEIESGSGTHDAGKLVEQLFRLIQQALPPHFPIIKLVNSDVVIVLDNMMSSYFENKIRAMASHIASGKKRIGLSFGKASAKQRSRQSVRIEDLVAQSGQSSQSEQDQLRNAI